MNFLDEMKGKIEAALGTTAPGLENQLKHVMDMINDPAHGGLAGLVQKFQSQGLGSTIQSWIGTGPNQAITAAQIQRVLGDGRIQALATKLGVSPEIVSQRLSTILPTVVDHLTPGGQVPGMGTPASAPKK